MSELLETGLKASRNRISTLPVILPGKRPALLEWESRQTIIPDEKTIRSDYARSNGNSGIAVICGKVSEGLEIIDHDEAGVFYSEWVKLVETEAPGLINRLSIQQTMSGGYHGRYRCREISGNQKLARIKIEVSGPGEHKHGVKGYKARQIGGRWFIYPIAIETRGEGAYAVTAPSPGYAIIQHGETRDFHIPPEITPVEREILLRCAKALDQCQDAAKAQGTQPAQIGKPGEDYNARATDTLDLLKKHGWQECGQRGDALHLTRPGKDRGVSASLFDGRVFHVFSSNADPFEPDKSYSRFAIRSILEHGGDYSKTARELREQGYGEPSYQEQPQTAGNRPEKNLIQIVTLEDVYRDEIEDTPIIDGLHYEDEALVIYADGGGGKSLISQDMGMHLGAEAPDIWDLFKIPKGRISLFVQSENSRKALQARARKKIIGKPDLMCGIGNVFYCGYSGAVQIAGAMIDEKFRTYLIDYAKAVEDFASEKIGNIVFDPLISYVDGDENDNAVMRRTLDLITETSGKIGATPTVLHHSNKANGLRGASAIQNWARSIIKLERIGAESDRRIMVTNTKNNNHEYFRPFALELDDNLNFKHLKQAEIITPKKAERCMAVADALRKIGGRAETQDALIEQYREDSKLKSDSAAQDHINLANKTGFILAEEYRDGNLVKKRYLLPKENSEFQRPETHRKMTK